MLIILTSSVLNKNTAPIGDDDNDDNDNDNDDNDNDNNDNNDNKPILLIESGVRFHLTKYSRDKNNFPSPFAMKLRKHIKTKRLEDVKQIGGDRVVDFKFGSGEVCNHIILELYSQGNVILTDDNYNVLALLRSYKFDDDVEIKVNEIYPMTFATTNINNNIINMNVQQFITWINNKHLENQASLNNDIDKKSKKIKPITAKKLLLHSDSGFNFYGSEIHEHCLVKAGIKPSLKLDEFVKLNDEILQKLHNELLQVPETIMKVFDVPGSKGYVILKDDTIGKKSTDSIPEFLEFVPFCFEQYHDKEYLEFDSFNEAVDEYFCKIEEQKLLRQAINTEEQAKKKVEKVRQEQGAFIKSLEDQQKSYQDLAMYVETYAEDIDKVLLVLNSAINSGMSWEDIGSMVATEISIGNPIASLVSRLKLDKNTVVLKLKRFLDDLDNDEDSEDSDSSEDSDDPNRNKKGSNRNIKKDISIEVEVDLSLSARANARELYQNRKVAKIKEEKTRIACEKALELVEEQSFKFVENQKLKRNLLTIRKTHWFEKFNWFISSEGYLILCGRDAQQNDLLVKKYLRNGLDIYVHADIPGAASCVIRAKQSSSTTSHGPVVISPFSIQEAAVMSICRSRAWENKIITSAYWVRADQVSKSAPTGEYLTTGSFMIYGKKNFLPPMSLEMGFGIMFRLDDSSIPRHSNDRKDRSHLLSDTSSYISEAMDRYGLDHDIEALQLTSIQDNNQENNDVDNNKNDDDDDNKDNEDSDNDNEENDDDVNGLNNENHQKVVDADKNECDLTNEKDNANDYPDSTNDDETDQKDEDVSEKIMTKDDADYSNISRVAKGKMKAKQTEHNSNQKLQISKDSSASFLQNNNKKKKVDKKKARRYGEQDEDDRELAMLALGHGKHVVSHEKSKSKQAVRDEEIIKKKEKYGLTAIKVDWETRVSILDVSIKALLDDLIEAKLMKDTEIDDYELKALSSFSVENAEVVLKKFHDKLKAQKVVNKSAALASLMAASNKGTIDETAKASTGVEISRHQRKKNEQKQIEQIIDDEGFMDEEEGKLAEETEKLTGCPVPEDQLLYAVPMCGPYSAFSNFKYKVKLTPGPQKKGKACKQAMELFMNSRDCNETEKQLMKGLTDPELVAIMIGDVKISTPGLQQMKRTKKLQRGQKKPK